MSHSRNSKSRHIPKVDREGSVRTTTRIAIHRGRWDDMPATLPTRSLRRPLKG